MLTPHLAGLLVAERHLDDLKNGRPPFEMPYVIVAGWSATIWRDYILAYDSWYDLSLLGVWHNVTLRERDFTESPNFSDDQE